MLGFLPPFSKYPNGNYRSDKNFSITTVDKMQLKCDCNSRKSVKRTRKPVSYKFALDTVPKNQFS